MKGKKAIYGLIIFSALGFSLSACSVESEVTSGGPNPSVKQESGYFSMNVRTAEDRLDTRAGETEAGADRESYINKVWVLFYSRHAAGDGADNAVTLKDVLEYAYELDIRNFEGELNDPADLPNITPSPFQETVAGSQLSQAPGVIQEHEKCTTTAWDMEVGNYYVIVLANPYPYMEGLTRFTPDLESGETFAGEKFYRLADFIGITGGYDSGTGSFTARLVPDFFFALRGGNPDQYTLLLMSNANGLVPVHAGHFRETQTLSEQNPLSVNIDRIVAKVMVNMAGRNVGNTVFRGGKVASCSWKLENVNEKTYAVRRYAGYDASAPAVGGKTENYATSIAASRHYVYATDPNFTLSGQSGLQGNTAEMHSWNDRWEQNGAEWVLNESSFAYILENTLDVASQQAPEWESDVSRAYLRIFIDFEDVFVSGGSYYSWNANTSGAGDPQWKVFTLEQARKWRASGNYPLDMQALETLVGNDTEPDPAGRPGTSSFFAVASSDLLVEPGYNTGGDGLSHISVDDESDPQITFHPDGLNEYRVPIKHFSPDTDDRSLYGQYGVVRNNVYRLNITRINGPGTPSGGWLSTKVTINPWYERPEQTEDL